jgi:hypothetical protein
MLSAERGNHNIDTRLKNITFELLLDDESKTRARIPLRIPVHPQDITDAIVARVKSFYGIYEGYGVSFEDVRGNILMAHYNNLIDGMTVNVRAIPDPVHSMSATQHSHYQHVTGDAQRRASLGEPFQMLPPHMHEQSRSPSRPHSRLAKKRSPSPQTHRGRRSASQQKAGSVSAASRGSSVNGTYQDDAFNGYSDSEEGRSSVAGSRKARSEQYASAEISSENILQDGRRNKILFESSVWSLNCLCLDVSDHDHRNCPSSSLLKYLSPPPRLQYHHSDAHSGKKAIHNCILSRSSCTATRITILCLLKVTNSMDAHLGLLPNIIAPSRLPQMHHTDIGCVTDRACDLPLRHRCKKQDTRIIESCPPLIPPSRVAYLTRTLPGS